MHTSVSVGLKFNPHTHILFRNRLAIAPKDNLQVHCYIDNMQLKSVSRIGIILFLFVFGFVCFRIGLGVGVFYYPFRGFDPTGAIHLLLTVIGAFSLILAVYLVKKRWF